MRDMPQVAAPLYLPRIRIFRIDNAFYAGCIDWPQITAPPSGGISIALDLGIWGPNPSDPLNAKRLPTSRHATSNRSGRDLAFPFR